MIECILDYEVAMYILSLALQVAGAVLLIIKYFGKTKDRIIDEYFPGSNIIERDKANKATLCKEKVQECVKRIYDNRMAFVFIAIGYVLSLFGATNNACKICLFLYLVIFTVVIILIEKSISNIIARKCYDKDIVISFEDIENVADTYTTEEEIKALFK